MQTTLQIDFTYDQVLSLVKQLPKEEKIMLTKELEKDKESFGERLEKLLTVFKTDELSEETINEEVEIVRQNRYDSRKH
jgi:flagellar biosynthesis regulator FlbT